MLSANTHYRFRHPGIGSPYLLYVKKGLFLTRKLTESHSDFTDAKDTTDRRGSREFTAKSVRPLFPTVPAKSRRIHKAMPPRNCPNSVRSAGVRTGLSFGHGRRTGLRPSLLYQFVLTTPPISPTTLNTHVARRQSLVRPSRESGNPESYTHIWRHHGELVLHELVDLNS